jgi:putative ABC transport system permease protein
LARIGALPPTLRFALANLHRPGAPIVRIVLALGLGATMLVGVALIEANLARQLREQLPERAPSFFFIDILPHQAQAFDSAARSVPGVTGLERTPMLRARIMRINGVPVDEANVQPSVRWALDSERGLTYAAEIPPGSEITAGRWWPADYRGPPQISFDAGLAAGMGLKPGDSLTFNILGREVEAIIANLRRVKWRSLGINFTVVFAPGTLERAPHSFIATAQVPPEREAELLAAVTDALPNVSAVRVRDAIEQAAAVFARVGFAIELVALVTIVAGLLVLAGAVAAGHSRRVYDAVVFKVLGATRRRIVSTFVLEYGFVGVATAVLAAALGSLIAWGVLTYAMRADHVWFGALALGMGLLAALVALLFGFAGTWRAMGRKAAPLLRNE